MKLKITLDTFLKQSTAIASSLDDEHKMLVQKGTERDITDCSETLYAGHYKVSFPEKVDGYQTWLVFADHCEILGKPQPKEFELKVPYFSQRDNKEQAWRTCNTSSHAMAAEFLKPGCIDGSDDLYWRKYVNPRGDTTSHSVQTSALAALGIKSEWRTDLDYDDLNQQLSKGKPIPISVYHKGTLANPSGGHVLVVIGRYSDGYICHDPWGEGFSYQNKNGESVRYPFASLNARWLESDRPGSGWGRIFY